jgi:hypothetical protein
MAKPTWYQPTLFGPSLLFVPRRRKRVVVREGGTREEHRTTEGPPLGVVYMSQRATKAKIDRAREAS